MAVSIPLLCGLLFLNSASRICRPATAVWSQQIQSQCLDEWSPSKSGTRIQREEGKTKFYFEWETAADPLRSRTTAMGSVKTARELGVSRPELVCPSGGAGDLGLPEDIRGEDFLIVVDVQKDFTANGSLAVPDGDEIVESLNQLICSGKFPHDKIVFTQDWHPPGHISFASSHPGQEILSTIPTACGPQILWPDHCVQESPGACFHEKLVVPDESWVIRKGSNPKVDSYSGFYENDKETSTGLGGFLKERQCQRVFVCGLAYDFCVRYTAEDGALRCGFTVFVLEKLTRAVDANGSLSRALQSLNDANVTIL